MRHAVGSIGAVSGCAFAAWLLACSCCCVPLFFAVSCCSVSHLQITMFVITTIFGVIRGALSRGNDRGGRRDDEDWD
jgi:hypothetical protein